MTTPTPKTAPPITCSGCTNTWTAGGAAHCAAPGCHRLFSTPRLFDLHRSVKGEHGACLDPEEIFNGSGERVMYLRDGMFRGPEMTAEQKLARFGNRSAA